MKEVSAKELYNEIAEKYNVYYHRDIDLAENEVVFESISYKGEKILDLGAGTGLFLEYCKAHPDKYTGMDVSEKMIEIAQKKFPYHHFALLDADDMYYLKNDYELVISLFGSMSYPENINRIFQRTHARLREYGRIYMMFYAGKYQERGYHVWELDEYKKIKKIYAKYQIYKDEYIYDLLDSIGFVNIRIYGLGFIGDEQNNGISKKKLKGIFRDEIAMKKSSSESYWMIVEGMKNNA